MTVFTVIGLRDGPQGSVRSRVEELYPNDNLLVSPNVWLIARKGTSKELSDSLGVTGGEYGTAIITSVSTYFGRAPTNIWDWMKAKTEETA